MLRGPAGLLRLPWLAQAMEARASWLAECRCDARVAVLQQKGCKGVVCRAQCGGCGAVKGRWRQGWLGRLRNGSVTKYSLQEM